MKYLIVIATSILLAACATQIEGVVQDIKVTSSPSGAVCAVSQVPNSQTLAWEEPQPFKPLKTIKTPTILRVHKSRGDLKFICSLTGHKTKTVVEESDISATSLLLGAGGAGAAGITDQKSGARWKYDDEINIVMEK